MFALTPEMPNILKEETASRTLKNSEFAKQNVGSSKVTLA
jgi:hypothetical protein